MKDSCNRTIDYLRLSVTDRCNLRCVYCMPESGVEFLPHDKIMTYEEMLRICRLMVDLGLRKVKITGGEPLVRKGIPWLIQELKALDGIESVTMTTNGILLQEQVKALVHAGLDAVNISLDTLDVRQFQSLTRFSVLDQVKAGIAEALNYSPDLAVKLNCVPVKEAGVDNQVLQLVKLAKDQPLHVRFIELMPIGLGKDMVGWSEQEIRDTIEANYGKLKPYTKTLGNGPCVYYSIEGFKGKIGFISAISHKFCDQCNRIRLTSDGFLKTCLQYGDGIDLKKAIMQDDSDQVLRKKIADSIFHKPLEHQFGKHENREGFEKETMSRIGG